MKTAVKTDASTTATGRKGMTHVPREPYGDPPVGLCGSVGKTGQRVRDAAPGELAVCVVCQSLWDAGER
jgi:hypothetical protein